MTSKPPFWQASFDHQRKTPQPALKRCKNFNRTCEVIGCDGVLSEEIMKGRGDGED